MPSVLRTEKCYYDAGRELQVSKMCAGDVERAIARFEAAAWPTFSEDHPDSISRSPRCRFSDTDNGRYFRTWTDERHRVFYSSIYYDAFHLRFAHATIRAPGVHSRFPQR